ncbi:MAG: hypothetical protein IPN76_06820 [Saprospiraceae bacterium]|nr:hypothetical protein [Saprospiraceae bacterium]
MPLSATTAASPASYQDQYGMPTVSTACGTVQPASRSNFLRQLHPGHYRLPALTTCIECAVGFTAANRPIHLRPIPSGTTTSGPGTTVCDVVLPIELSSFYARVENESRAALLGGGAGN